MKLWGNVWFWVLAVVLALLSFDNSLAHADGLDVINLRELSIDYKNFAMLNPNARDLLIYPEHPKEGMEVNVDTTLFQYLYWDSRIHATTTDAQYRAIGLEMRLGVNFSEYLQVGYYHHSQHVMDREDYLPRFPVEDAVEVKLFLFRSKGSSPTIF